VLHGARQNKDSHYYQLYLTFTKYPGVSLAELRHQYKHLTQLSYEIHHLYEKLLQSLVNDQLNSNKPQDKLSKLLLVLEILQSKQNFKAVSKLLKKAKKLANEQEDFSALLRLVSIEESVGFSTIDSNLLHQLESLSEERRKVVAQINEINELRYLKVQVIDMQYNIGLFLTPDRFPPGILNHRLLDANYQPLSLKAKDTCLFINGMIQMFLGNFERALHFKDQRIDLTRENIPVLGEEEYAKSLNNYLAVSCMAENHESFGKRASELRTAQFARKRIRDLAQYFVHFTHVQMSVVKLNFEELKVLLPAAEYFVIAHQGQPLNATQIINLLIYAVPGNLLIKNYASAHRLMAIWQTLPTSDSTRAYHRILSICTHLALGNLDFVAHELSAFRKLCRRKRYHNKAFLTFIQCATALVKKPSQKAEIKQEYAALFDELFHDNLLKSYFLSIDFRQWIRHV